jgi:hypothetical protein
MGVVEYQMVINHSHTFSTVPLCQRHVMVSVTTTTAGRQCRLVSRCCWSVHVAKNDGCCNVGSIIRHIAASACRTSAEHIAVQYVQQRVQQWQGAEQL